MTGSNATNEATNKKNDEGVDIWHYRKLVRQFSDMRRYQSALFWAEKVCVLGNNKPNDVFYLAQCMFMLKEYHRAAHTIRMHELEKSHVPCYNLLLESLYEAKEYNDAISVINSVDIEYLASSLINQQLNNGENQSHSLICGDDSKNEILAAICYIKGKIYEAMDNRGLAMDLYVQALHKSIYCYEALEALLQHEMLMAWEEKELMQHLPFKQQATEADAEMIKKLYECKLKKYYESVKATGNGEGAPISKLSSFKTIKELSEMIQKNRNADTQLYKSSAAKFQPTQLQILSPGNRLLEDIKNSPFSLQVSLSRVAYANNESMRSQNEIPRQAKEIDNQNVLSLSCCLERLKKSTDIMAADAEKHFYDCQYKKSFNILNELLKIDPYHNAGLTVQIGCLVEFGDYNKLFYAAHKLVDRYPDKAISWYAVGCYYDLIGKSDPARRYLSKATSLDRLYGPAWLAYGHSFAKENEHDQAMAAYFKATQLMRGCHLPLLYIGVECGLTKNLELAEKFFLQAMSIAPLDVFVLHELGVIKYEYNYFESAEEVFRATVELVKKRACENNEEVSSRWEPLFNNLGHCCRKTKKYEEALQHHEYALMLKPNSAQTYTAIGFVHALMNNLEEAIAYFHRSLCVNRDCIVTTTILKTCMEDLMGSNAITEAICGNTQPSYYKLSEKSTDTFIKISAATPNTTKPNIDDEDNATNMDNMDTTNLIMDISMDL